MAINLELWCSLFVREFIKVIKDLFLEVVALA
jgi:hypothetical protein